MRKEGGGRRYGDHIRMMKREGEKGRGLNNERRNENGGGCGIGEKKEDKLVGLHARQLPLG